MAGSVGALATVTALGSAFGKQSRGERQPRPTAPAGATDVIIRSPNPKIAKLALKNAREERLLHILSQPEVIGLASVFGGLFLANKIPFADTEPQNSAIQSIAATSAVLMGLGHAGVGDLTTLTVSGLAGAATFSKGFAEGEGSWGWLDRANQILRFISDPLGAMLGVFQ